MKFSKTHKGTAESYRMHCNVTNAEEVWSFKCLILKYRRGDQIIQPFCTVGSPQEIRSPLFNLRKFSNTDKSTAELCRMHWNLMNDKEVGFFKCLILKYRREDQITNLSSRINFPPKKSCTSLILKNFQKLTKVLMNNIECIGM